MFRMLMFQVMTTTSAYAFRQIDNNYMLMENINTYVYAITNRMLSSLQFF